MSVDLWRLQAFIGLVIGSLIVAHRITTVVHWVAGVAIGYALISAAIVFQGPWELYPGLQFRLDQSAGQAFAQLIIAAVIAGFRPTWVLIAAQVLGIVNGILILFFGYGMFNASSADACFVVMGFHLFLHDTYGSDRGPEALALAVYIIIVVSAIFITGGTTASAMCVVGALALFGLRPMAWACGIFAVAVTLATSGVSEFINSHGRFTEWARFLSWWSKNANPLFGTGTGTFEWLGPMIQARPKDLYLFMHNDYLQVLFEQGIMGLLLMLGVIGLCFWKTWHSPSWRALLASTCVMMGTQFPMRFFISGTIICTIIGASLTPRLHKS